MRRPNADEPLSTAVMHTIEHSGAAFLLPGRDFLWSHGLQSGLLPCGYGASG
ncbi:MAG: hypothetical protein IJ088_03025 [Clostridia bacterium]|nr:hypothetical protein [Clostridia bacterium]